MTHEPLITDELWEACTAQRALGEQRRAPMRSPHRRTYCLASLVVCGVSGRRMTGSWNNGQSYYRCGFPTEYAGATGRHPRWVYLRESDVVPALDEWLLSVFDPKNLDATVAAMAAAQEPDDAAAARAEAAGTKLKDSDSRLAKCRTALEHGTPPEIVAGWIKDVEAERVKAQRELDVEGRTAPLTEAEIRALTTSQRKVLRGLAKATPEQRAAIYGGMELRLTYSPDEPGSVIVEANPEGMYETPCRRRDLNPHALAGTSPSIRE